MCQGRHPARDPVQVKAVPLRLALQPLLPSRTPAGGDCFEYGFHLRLPNGPVLRRDDPLLAAFGACVADVDIAQEHEEGLQADGFDPGRPVRFIAEPDDEEAIGVWDADGLRQAGTLACSAGRIVRAGLEAGLEPRALVLMERRTAHEDRRDDIVLLTYSPALVRIAIPRSARVERPVRAKRPRLILAAGPSGDVRWWDPSGHNGPLPAGELPLSPELRRDLVRLRDAYAAVADEDDERRGFDRVEADWERQELDGQAAALWRRARAELGQRYAVGFLGSGMRRPVWSPSELDDDGAAVDIAEAAEHELAAQDAERRRPRGRARGRGAHTGAAAAVMAW